MLDRLTVAKSFARALVLDIKGNSILEKDLDRLILERPAEEAGQFIRLIKTELVREAKDDFEGIVLPRTRALFRKGLKEELELHSGMGQLFSSLAKLALPALVAAGTAIYVGKLNLDAQKDIAKMELSLRVKEAEAIKKEAEARIKIAEAAMEVASQEELALPERGVSSRLEKGPSLPVWLLPVGVVLGGGILIFLLTRKGKKR